MLAAWQQAKVPLVCPESAEAYYSLCTAVNLPWIFLGLLVLLREQERRVP